MTDVERFAAAAVARLATIDRTGAPHIVPITFVAGPDLIHTPIDHKPKRTTRLRRLDNISAEPRVSVLVDHYDDAWERLWWVRADGTASVIEPGVPAHEGAASDLAAKYPPYRDHPIRGPIIEIRVQRWMSWDAAGP